MSHSAMHSDMRGPNCWQCRFFAVSWDPRLPYACRSMGFKTKVLPAIEVLRTDGLPCQSFTPRAPAAAAAPQAPAALEPGRKNEASTRSMSTRLWQA